ncbi:MAG: response regulator transcription factor [Bryobacterales bacterium]|nr:response regulator transcription factor [Bryobacterales bacterium]MBV9396569.1 response regulator transcription factor [Bryobacterales bacterium]
MIRLHIAARSAVTRAGLESLLGHYADIELGAREEDADVILSDGAVPVESEVPVVLLGDDLAARNLRGAVRAVLPRDAPAEQIAAAIQAAAAGLTVVPAGELLPFPAPPDDDGTIDRLTRRELDVLEMLAEGLSNKMIAYRLSISEHTAKFHVNSILAKLRAGTRTEAVMRGVRLGLVKI